MRCRQFFRGVKGLETIIGRRNGNIGKKLGTIHFSRLQLHQRQIVRLDTGVLNVCICKHRVNIDWLGRKQLLDAFVVNAPVRGLDAFQDANIVKIAH
jgi:hypothetical protein